MAWVVPEAALACVMAQVPLSAMLTTHARVTTAWWAAIARPQFLPWKKLYHRLKLAPHSRTPAVVLGMEEPMEASSIIKHLCEDHRVSSLEDCLVNIIRLMGGVHDVALSEDVRGVLATHPLYEPALSTLQHLQHLVPTPHTAWHVLATMALLAEDMWQVDLMIQRLQRPLRPQDITEGFYCLAALLLHCTNTLNLPGRYHYIIFYALYMYENRWVKDPEPPGRSKRHGGQQSMLQYVQKKVPLTHEQMTIVNHDIQPNHLLKIMAFAGTGKTTTLREMCLLRPHQRVLLAVYNKSVQEHCANTFPKNVTAKTTHSLAFARLGWKYVKIKKMEFVKDIDINILKEFLEKKEGSGNWMRRAALVKKTVLNFISSVDDQPTLDNVPSHDNQHEPIDDDYRLKILLDDARAVWKEMNRCTPDQKIHMFQDALLKAWQLTRPRITGYDVIMVDEGQDTNPAVLQVFLDQHCARVIVGDPHQQIYEFRGAINALENIQATHTFYLTQSFRFGPEVSFVAQCILQAKDSAFHKHTLVGGRKRDQVLVSARDSPQVDGKKLQRAYVARYNFSLYSLAIQMCSNEENNGLTMTFAGGIDTYKFDIVEDIYYLSKVNGDRNSNHTANIKSKLIVKFKYVKELEIYAKNTEDVELLQKIKMFEYSKDATPEHIKLLKGRCAANPSSADVIFSTIHKAKGLQFDWVIMVDDITPKPHPGLAKGPPGVHPRTSGRNSECTSLLYPEECNLLYVAATRAKVRLSINSGLLQALNLVGETWELLVAARNLGPDSQCVRCRQLVQKSWCDLVTKAKAVVVGECGTVVRKEGFICTRCVSEHQFNLPPTPRKESHNEVVEDFGRVARWTLLTGERECGVSSATAQAKTPSKKGPYTFVRGPAAKRGRESYSDDDILGPPVRAGSSTKIRKDLFPAINM